MLPRYQDFSFSPNQPMTMTLGMESGPLAGVQVFGTGTPHPKGLHYYLGPEKAKAKGSQDRFEWIQKQNYL